MEYLIRTDRLGLRNWDDKDLQPFASLCADERVMQFFPATLNREQSDQLVHRFQRQYQDHGYTYFAVDRLDSNTFIGFVGLMQQNYPSHFTPCVDIGWRLAPSAWGKGFATEGAMACLHFGFERLQLDEIYSVAPKINIKSQRVMQKLGMQFHSTFEHPKLKESGRLNPCVVYKIERDF